MDKRITVVMFIVIVSFFYLTMQIFSLQIFQGTKLASQAIAMRSRYIELSEYPRGDIFDRNHSALTSSTSVPTLFFIPSFIDQKAAKLSDDLLHKKQLKQDGYNEIASFLVNLFYQEDGKIMSDKKSSLIKQMQEADKRNESAIKLRSNLNSNEEEAINKAGIEGLFIAPTKLRYRDDMFASHIIGYLNNENGGTGVSGIEKIYDELLRAVKGKQGLAVTFDAVGNVIPGLVGKIKQEQASSAEVVLTIDKRVQEIAEQVMDKSVNKGAVVIMDIANRDILAMVSRPTYNPYAIELANSDNIGKPLINRALTAYYPGSMFKIVDTIAALEEGIVKSNSNFNCNGMYTFSSGRQMSCWLETGHGSQTFAQAFANSCNPSFIEVILQLGRNKLMKYSNNLQICNDEIVGYPGYKSNSYVKIDAGQVALANACLGQQGVMLSPLQICSLIATVADDGKYRPPALVINTLDNKGLIKNSLVEEKQAIFSRRTALVVKSMMEKNVLEGTGKNAAIKECSIAGKTATAQTGRYIEDKEVLNVWFGGYFPADKPRWAAVILVEEGKSGAQDCAPLFANIAREILKINMINQ